MKLRDVLPSEFLIENGDCRAAKFLDVDLVASHGLGDGPNDDNRNWIGPQRNVYCWWELANGYAVGWNDNPARGWSYPVVRIPNRRRN